MCAASVTPLNRSLPLAEAPARLRGQLPPLVRACVTATAALRDHVVDSRPDAQTTAVAERALNAAKSLERLVLSAVDPRAEAGLGTAAAQRRLRHDLRNPIAAVRGFVEILSEDLEPLGLGHLAGEVEGLLRTADLTLETVDRVLDVEAPVPAPMAPPTERNAGSIGRVLVVDDDESMRALLVEQLARDGHDATAAADGDAALERLREGHYDVVLLDLNMPGLSGLDVLGRIVGNPGLRDTAVIMVSSAGQDERIVRCIEAGAIDYLVKPVKPVLLRARLAQTMARKRWRDADREYRERMETEKRKSESLLLNILPRQIVVRLSAGEDVITDAFDNVSVLFTDFVGFTRLSSRLTPRQVVEGLNRVFSAFDDLVLGLNVEKIKMIGDAYMAVAGLPAPRLDHAEAIAELALGMQEKLTQINSTLVEPLQMRIGIASGAVVAGVIGTHKFAFYVWGHTVNMASRHASYCEPGRIHVAVETEPLLRERYKLESRGILNIRGRGDVETFYLVGRKAAT